MARNNSVNTSKPVATKAPRTKVARAIPHDEANDKAKVANDEDLFAQAYARYQEAQDFMLRFFKAPSWKRTLVAFVTSLLVGAGVAWVAGSILEWMVIGATAMGVSTFVTVIVYALGFIAALYYGGKLAARVGGAVLTGEADERAIAAYDAVKSKLAKLNPFGKRSVEAVA